MDWNKEIESKVDTDIIIKESIYKIEQHFFKKGYEYALLHFSHAVEEEKIKSGLEKKILKHMDFLK